MLILNRRCGEAIVIDGRIRVMVTSIHGGHVKLGIKADGLTVDREEIHARRVREKPRPGVCRICGCTELKACDLGLEACSWVNKERTLCSNPACLEATEKVFNP